MLRRKGNKNWVDRGKRNSLRGCVAANTTKDVEYMQQNNETLAPNDFLVLSHVTHKSHVANLWSLRIYYGTIYSASDLPTLGTYSAGGECVSVLVQVPWTKVGRVSN